MNFTRARRTVGLSLMLSSLVAGIFAAPAATAAEAEVPEGLEKATIVQQAYWNADQAKYADNSVTKEWPPQAVCLVQPQACFFPEGGTITGPDGEEYEDPTGGELGARLNEGSSQIGSAEQELLTTMAENDDGTEPADPVPPENHPVSVAFGQQNYRSAIQFELPELPDGEQVDEFFVVLTQGDPTYSNESPAFRQAVLAALTCASENQESPFGRCTPEEFEKIPDSELRGDEPLSVEACPITSDWEPGGSQDEDDLPEVDCLYTAPGVPVAYEGETVWVFDMFFAARAWYDGTLEQKGVLFRPGTAENFAYGDPETTYSKQVTFLKPVQVAMTSSPEPAPPTPPAPPPAPSSGFSTGGSGSGDLFSTPQTSGPVGVPAGSSTPPQTTEQPPAVSQPETVPQPSPEQPVQTLAAGTPLGQPQTPWWLWALVPTFLAGAWLLSRALAEEAVLATQRSGAMTRLLERQSATQTPDLVTG